MYMLKSIFQVFGLLGVATLSNQMAEVLHLQIPGSILGIAIVFFLLEAKVITLDWVEAGANLLIAELLLFFIPSAVGIIQYRQLIIANGARFGLVILFSTITVMICTGLIAEYVNKMGRGR
jgi:holin-like protein